jgi:hypothetical protein
MREENIFIATLFVSADINIFNSSFVILDDFRAIHESLQDGGS